MAYLRAASTAPGAGGRDYYVGALAALTFSERGPGYYFGMFIFFNNRMGCLRSLIVSAMLTLLLLVLLGVLRGH